MERTRNTALRWGSLMALAVAIVAGTVLAQAMEFNLDGKLDGTADGQAATAKLGRGATFVASAEGQGVEPGESGPAVILRVPDALWKSAGTLAFRFRLSRDLRFSEPRPISMVLVKCPVFKLVLHERRKHVILQPTMAVPKGSSRAIRRAATGRLFWSHLKGGKWYHLAFAWDAAKGRMEVCLNGVLQQQMRLRTNSPKWTPAPNPSGALELGGSLGQGDKAARIAIDSVQLYPAFMDAAQVKATLKGKPTFALAGEGRWDFAKGFDLGPYKLTLVYETDFDGPLSWIHEDKLFDGDKRARKPEGVDWVLEGQGTARGANGMAVIQSNDEALDKRVGQHLVFWNTRPFPENFLLEFAVSLSRSREGLAIVFFATRNLRGGSPFDLDAPKRSGNFRTYHSGDLNGYHASYWACNPFDGGVLRRTTNLRKNKGFYMPCAGIDRIGGLGEGPHRVRILKVGGKIRIETRGKLALVFDDDGKTYGPVWKDGWIGLRQMGSAHRVSYDYFKVWKVGKR